MSKNEKSIYDPIEIRFGPDERFHAILQPTVELTDDRRNKFYCRSVGLACTIRWDGEYGNQTPFPGLEANLREVTGARVRGSGWGWSSDLSIYIQYKPNHADKPSVVPKEGACWHLLRTTPKAVARVVVQALKDTYEAGVLHKDREAMAEEATRIRDWASGKIVEATKARIRFTERRKLLYQELKDEILMGSGDQLAEMRTALEADDAFHTPAIEAGLSRAIDHAQKVQSNRGVFGFRVAPIEPDDMPPEETE